MKKKLLSIITCLFLLISIPSVIGNKNINEDEIDPITTTDVDWWPMFGHDPERTSYSTSAGPNKNSIIWTYTMDDPSFSSSSSPAVVDGKVYIGSFDYNVYCLDAETGDKIWNYTTDFVVTSSPAVVDGKVYIGALTDVICLDAGTGNKIWNYNTTSIVIFDSSPAVYQGKVYIGSVDYNVYCLDAEGNGDGTTTEIWNFTTGGAVFSSPAVYEGKVYIGSDDNNVYCLNADNGSEIWNYTTGSFVRSSPAVYEDKIYVGSQDTKVHCLDSLDGSKIWNFTTNAVITSSSPAIAYGNVYIGSGGSYIDGGFYCLNAEDGTVNWNITFNSDGTRSSPAIADGKVYVGTDNAYFYCWNATGNGDGTTDLIWSSEFHKSVISSPAVVEGKLYIGADFIYCFSDNEPPETPDQPDGPTFGYIYEEYTYTTDPVIDPEGDPVQYLFNWGDGTDSGWVETPIASKAWDEDGIFNVNVQARDIFSATSNWSIPMEVTIRTLEIEEITGGLFKVDVLFKNLGHASVTDVNWNITVNGGILGLVDVLANGTIPTIGAGATEIVTAKPIIGLGPITITFTASADFVEEVTMTADGFVFFGFVIIS